MFSLAVDVMGGDLGPRVALKACKRLLKKRSNVRLVVCVLQEQVEFAEQYLQHSQRVQVIGCEHQINMDDRPSQILRQSKTSSMARALTEVANGNADAAISAGNTGVLMALAKHILPMYEGIDRPALATLIPTRSKPLLLLDLGANINVSAVQLLQFAALGVSWCKAQGNSFPRIGLLNVGKEITKGTERLREADELLTQALGEHYQGFCEGHDIYAGELNVIVTDGFVGNMVLKASEGLSELLIERLQAMFKHHWLRYWFAWLWAAPLRELVRTISPRYNAGALLLGINGLVVKTHGSSDVRTFEYALHYLLEQLEHHENGVMQKNLNGILNLTQ